jgi:transposase
MVSQEKRSLISEAKKDGMSVKEMARVYRVPERTIRGLLKHEQDTGSMDANTGKCGRPPAVSGEGLELMRKIIEEQPDITLEEIKGKMNLSICLSAICRIIRNKLGFTYKKNFTRKRAGQREKQSEAGGVHKRTNSVGAGAACIH